MMKCLVTGSTGFVGSRLLNLLKLVEYDVRLLGRSKVDTYEVVECNLGQEEIPRNALESIDVVFHLAGFAHDMQNPRKVRGQYHKINVDATVELAKMAAESGVKIFVFVSSTKAGGPPVSDRCACEDDQGLPEGVYGETKREAELQLLKIDRQTDMCVTIVRPSLVYGPNVKGNLRLMLAGIGRNYFPPLPEVQNKRSMIHVDDLVRAILFVSKDEHAKGEIFIATDGASYSSREIYNIMREVLNKPRLKWSVPKLLFDIVGSVSSSARYKINKLLGSECYSSDKLKSLGFKAEKSLRDINETDF